MDEDELTRRRADPGRRRRNAAAALKLPPVMILGWIVGQGFTHDLPWVATIAIVAALCLIASWALDYL